MSPVKKENQKSSSKKKEVKKPVTKEVTKPKEEKLEEFSWDSVNDFSTEYSDKERKDLEKLYTDSLNNIVEKQVIEAKVVGITNRDVVLNVGSKSDGIVSSSEFHLINVSHYLGVVKSYSRMPLNSTQLSILIGVDYSKLSVQ